MANTAYKNDGLGATTIGVIMPPTLKKLMGHIAFGASVSGCVRASHFLYPPQTGFVGGYTVFTSSVRASVRP